MGSGVSVEDRAFLSAFGEGYVGMSCEEKRRVALSLALSNTPSSSSSSSSSPCGSGGGRAMLIKESIDKILATAGHEEEGEEGGDVRGDGGVVVAGVVQQMVCVVEHAGGELVGVMDRQDRAQVAISRVARGCIRRSTNLRTWRRGWRAAFPSYVNWCEDNYVETETCPLQRLHAFTARTNRNRRTVKDGRLVTVRHLNWRQCAVSPLLKSFQRRQWHVACEMIQLAGREDKAREMLSLRDESDCTALHLAAAGGCTAKIIALLIEIYPEALRHRDMRGATPLHYGASARDSPVESIRLIADGFPEGVSLKTASKMTPLQLSAWHKASDEVVCELVRRAPSAATCADRHGRTALHYAVWSGCSVGAVDAIRRASDEAVRIKDDCGLLPIHLAAERGQSNAVAELLLDAHPHGVVERDILGNTPLHYASCCHAPLALIELLVRRAPRSLDGVPYLPLAVKNFANTAVLKKSLRVGKTPIEVCSSKPALEFLRRVDKAGGRLDAAALGDAAAVGAGDVATTAATSTAQAEENGISGGGHDEFDDLDDLDAEEGPRGPSVWHAEMDRVASAVTDDGRE